MGADYGWRELSKLAPECRLHVRHGLTVIAGCFILFGARSIVAGIQSQVVAGEAVEVPASHPSPFADLPPPAPPAARPDPYAGAAVPVG